MKCKKKTISGVLISNFEAYTRNSWVADEEQKKVSGILMGSFETYTRYFWVADEEQKLSLKCIY